MTTIAPTVSLGEPGPAPVRLIRSELLKLWTTKTWWLFALGSLGMTALALLTNILTAHFQLTEPPPEGMSPQDAAVYAGQANVVAQAANIYTSGQFFGVLFVSLLGMIIVTNEFQHQTATTTFLTTPHRTAVIIAKLAAAIGLAVFFWLFTTAIDLVVGAIYFSADGFDNAIGDWEVTRAILLNLLAYAMWAILGIGVGILLRSQIGATITGTVVYLVGYPAAFIVFNLIHSFLIKEDWVMTAMVIVPAIASQVMVSPVKTWAQSPPQWVGVAVMIGYAVVFGTIGTLINRKRDIS